MNELTVFNSSPPQTTNGTNSNVNSSTVSAAANNANNGDDGQPISYKSLVITN